MAVRRWLNLVGVLGVSLTANSCTNIGQNHSSHPVACAYVVNCSVGGEQKIACDTPTETTEQIQEKSADPKTVAFSRTGPTSFQIATQAGKGYNYYANNGLFIPFKSTPCQFELTFTASLERPVVTYDAPDPTTDSYGWGFGIGACDQWRDGDAHGFSFQYGATASTLDPTRSTKPQLTWQPLPNKNEAMLTTPTSFSFDSQPHDYRAIVKNGEIYISQGQSKSVALPITDAGAKPTSIEGELPDDCTNSGVFLSAYNAVVDFQDIRISAAQKDN